jgi:putative acetyltransferase
MPDRVGLDVSIRHECSGDIDAIGRIHEEAFGQPQEACLVEQLRANHGILLSLVAVAAGQIVGHILYSPVSLDAGGTEVQGAGLGPMAVLPGFQRAGVGSRLVAEGTRRLRQRGCPFIVVVGHPDYYPRFGFVPGSRHGVRCQWDVPDAAFMMLPLDRSRLDAAPGLARYRDEFGSVT